MSFKGYIFDIDKAADSFTLKAKCTKSQKQWTGTFKSSYFSDFGSLGKIEKIVELLQAGFCAKEGIQIQINNENSMLVLQCETLGLVKMRWSLHLSRVIYTSDIERVTCLEERATTLEESLKAQIKDLFSNVSLLKNQLEELKKSNLHTSDKRCILLPGCNKSISKKSKSLIFINTIYDMPSVRNSGSYDQNTILNQFFSQDIYLVSPDTDFEGLDELPNLVSFEYYGALNKSFTALKNCKNLTNLTISPQKIRQQHEKGQDRGLDNIEWISSLSSLKQVSFEGCGGLNNTNIKPIGLLKNLEELNLKGTEVQPGTVFCSSPAVKIIY